MIYYHNPRCSKSRKGLEILQKSQVDFQIKEYLKDGLTVDELLTLCSRLGKRPEEIIRKKESSFKDLNIPEALDDKEWCQVISDHPILLERPILDSGKSAIIGRPPEELVKIL